jgi:hypothetical protein
LTRDEIRARLAGRAFGTRGNGSVERDNIRAAVLVPLVERDEGWFVVLTLRSADLADHAGQISLPGGRIEPGTPIRAPRRCAKPTKRSASKAITSRPPAGSIPGSPAPASR